MAACMIFENGSPEMNGGAPTMRLMLAPASSFEVMDTWYTTGMRGTGSYDFRAANLFIPEEHASAPTHHPNAKGRLSIGSTSISSPRHTASCSGWRAQ